MKIKSSILCLLLVFFLTGCVPSQKLRPQRCENEIWVCRELDNTYFYWDKEQDIFYGNLTYGEKNHEFFLSGSYGDVLSFVDTANLNEEGVYLEKYRIISGVADYQETFFTLKIKQDPKNIFNGNIKKITFLCCDREEYFKNLNPEDAE